MDPLLSRNYGKIEMIRWSTQNGIPLEKTRSCYTSNVKHCGICLTCSRRREAFKKALVKDKTQYEK
jgi:7-cyano-7-deazaguanine synthase